MFVLSGLKTVTYRGDVLWVGSDSVVTPLLRAISIVARLWMWLLCPFKIIRIFACGVGFTTDMKWRIRSQNVSEAEKQCSVSAPYERMWCQLWRNTDYIHAS
jgi:hypothetical protein